MCQMSALLREFLTDRAYNKNGADGALARALLDYRVPYAPYGETDEARKIRENKEDYLDMRLHETQPRLTYTTWAKAKDVPRHMIFTQAGHRTAARPARLAQRLTGITDGHALDTFTQAMGAYLSDTPEILLATGTDITFWYSAENYCGCRDDYSSIHDSCMKGAYYGAVGTFRIYEDAASLAVIRCPTCTGARARALVWTDTEGARWLDRTYSSERDRHHLFAWAEEQGISQLYGVAPPRQVTVPVDASYHRFPYFDTMAHCSSCKTLFRSPGYHTCHPHVTTFPEPTGLMTETLYTGKSDVMVCPSCGAEYDGDDRCPNEEYCDRCDEYYCGDNCPNEQYCSGCGEYYCIGWGEACPGLLYCDDCNTEYCGHDGCPNMEECVSCEVTEHLDGDGCCPDCGRCDECREPFPLNDILHGACDACQGVTVGVEPYAVAPIVAPTVKVKNPTPSIAFLAGSATATPEVLRAYHELGAWRTSETWYRAETSEVAA